MGSAKNYTSADLFKMAPEELIKYLNKLCSFNTPASIETVDDMKEAAKLLGQLGPLYSYLSNMEMTANVQKRFLKKDKDKKELYDSAITREYIFSSYVEQVKMLYNTVSRMLTIKNQIAQELRMLGETV